MKRLLFLVAVLMIVCVSIASADTCSFINITTGPQGPQGPPGLDNMTAGPQGPAGTNGSNGINGTNGTAATIAINYTFTLSPGSPATATNLGDSTNALIDFGIPQGTKGDKGDTGAIPDVSQFLFINGTRSMTGNLSMGNNYITDLHSPSVSTDAATKGYCDAIPIYNASYWTGTNYNSSYWTGSNYNASYLTSTYNATYDAKTNYNASYWTGTNYNSSYLTSTYNSTYDAKPSSTYNATYDAKAPAAQSAYLTLMAGSAMIPTTNPPAFDQYETGTNHNNYIYANFTQGGSENLQWIIDMPSDWNGSVSEQFLWTAWSGTGNINWTLSGKLFPDNTAIDTSMPVISYSQDTLQSANYMHVSPASTLAAVTSAGTGGNTVIFKVTRSAATSSELTATGELLGVRLHYYKTVTA